MFLVKLQTSEDINNYTPPPGYVVVFAEESAGLVSIRCKTSSGEILNIVGSVEQGSAELDEVNNTVVIPQATLSESLQNVVELPQAEVEGTILVI